MAIVIPPRLSELLKDKDRLEGAVHSALALTTTWFADNKLVFFPEYTDHGPTHVQDVLKSSEALIPNDTWVYLSPEDSAVLVLASVLHDCAMHLSEDGFISL